MGSPTPHGTYTLWYRSQKAGAKFKLFGLYRTEAVAMEEASEKMLDWNDENIMCPACNCGEPIQALVAQDSVVEKAHWAIMHTSVTAKEYTL